MNSQYLYIIGRYRTLEQPTKILPLFIQLKPNNIIIAKLDLSNTTGTVSEVYKQITNFISTICTDYKEIAYLTSYDDIIKDGKYKEFLGT